MDNVLAMSEHLCNTTALLFPLVRTGVPAGESWRCPLCGAMYYTVSSIKSAEIVLSGEEGVAHNVLFESEEFT